ncbi:hypothetical protein [Pandoraea pnomenusa]|uniref:hypothetical protein n=1 Tax=Pandoraea pnomenusa TaxID=93220 RepID=UPI001ACE634F|nr:hypothetical protein [Pandoraea pnomenusa]MBN9094723.1 hypothetical protein [Pandoraea pnomenusa]MBN9120732.1 hypothetical protein [Planctomycetota bacterium]
MTQGGREWRFWGSATVRLCAIFLAGCATVLWFQGCLVPVMKDEVREDQQKAAGSIAPAR